MKVPAQLVPSVGPTTQPTPSLHLNTPSAAFGENVALAIQHIGAVTGQAGAEMTSRAEALQSLQNETNARQADADAMVEMGTLHANFSSLQGQAAGPDAFKKYQDDLRAVYQKYRDGLTNPDAQRRYDSSALGNLGRSIFNGAGHMATQVKKAANDAATASEDASINSIDADPRKPIGRQLQQIESSVHTRADLGGWDDAQRANELFKAKGRAISHRIEELARTDPVRARDMLEQNRNQMHYVDLRRAEAVVRSEQNTTGARIIADNVTRGFPAYWSPGVADRVQGVQTPLVDVMKDALRAVDGMFTVGEGKKQFASPDGSGLTLVPIGKDGKPDPNDKSAYDRLHQAMVTAAEQRGVQLDDSESKYGHFELPRTYDIRDYKTSGPRTERQMVDEGVAAAKRQDPDNTNFHTATEARIMQQVNRDRQMHANEEFQARNTLQDAINGAYQNGKIPTSVEELKALDPKVAKEWEKLDPVKQAPYIKQMAKEKARVDDMSSYMKLMGMMKDPERIADFVDHDLSKEPLSPASMRYFLNQQRQLKQKAEGDPRVNRALTLLNPMLEAAGLTRNRDPDGKAKFVGALADQLESIAGEKKRGASPEEVRKIGAQLLQSTVVPSWHSRVWDSTERVFELQVPSEDAERIKGSRMWQAHGITPSDDMIQRVYVQEQFQKLYGKKESK